MSLADERRSRRFKDYRIDAVTLRVFLALVGTLMLGGSFLGISNTPGQLEWWGWVLLGLLITLGAFLLLLSVFGSRNAVCRWSDAASSHEVAIILVVVASPLAWAIRRALHRN